MQATGCSSTEQQLLLVAPQESTASANLPETKNVHKQGKFNQKKKKKEGFQNLRLETASTESSEKPISFSSITASRRSAHYIICSSLFTHLKLDFPRLGAPSTWQRMLDSSQIKREVWTAWKKTTKNQHRSRKQLRV